MNGFLLLFVHPLSFKMCVCKKNNVHTRDLGASLTAPVQKRHSQSGGKTLAI